MAGTRTHGGRDRLDTPRPALHCVQPRGILAAGRQTLIATEMTL
jgi:hypothetical protein